MGEYYEYKAHANIVRDISEAMATKWNELWSYYVKILIALGLAENLDILIPELQPDFKSLYEQKPQKRRATSNTKKIKTVLKKIS